MTDKVTAVKETKAERCIAESAKKWMVVSVRETENVATRRQVGGSHERTKVTTFGIGVIGVLRHRVFINFRVSDLNAER